MKSKPLMTVWACFGREATYTVQPLLHRKLLRSTRKIENEDRPNVSVTTVARIKRYKSKSKLQSNFLANNTSDV